MASNFCFKIILSDEPSKQVAWLLFNSASNIFTDSRELSRYKKTSFLWGLLKSGSSFIISLYFFVIPVFASINSSVGLCVALRYSMSVDINLLYNLNDHAAVYANNLPINIS